MTNKLKSAVAALIAAPLITVPTLALAGPPTNPTPITNLHRHTHWVKCLKVHKTYLVSNGTLTRQWYCLVPSKR